MIEYDSVKHGFRITNQDKKPLLYKFDFRLFPIVIVEFALIPVFGSYLFLVLVISTIAFICKMEIWEEHGRPIEYRPIIHKYLAKSAFLQELLFSVRGLPYIEKNTEYRNDEG